MTTGPRHLTLRSASVVRRCSFLLGCLGLPLAGCGDSTSEPVNSAPVAMIEASPGAVRGDTVVLDGTGSSDADGDSLTFAWSLDAAPIGSSAVLVPSDGANPAFVADQVGNYLVTLIVNDGRAASAPQSITIPVAVPAPVVTIATPQDLAVVVSSPVTVTGEVDDPSATVSVNGVPASVDALTGAYTASVPLQEGSNVLTAEATNATGTGAASIAVILNTADAPAVIITAPAIKFLIGSTYFTGQTPVPATLQVKGVIRVFTVEAANTPSVTISGVAATVGDTTFGGCPTTLPKRCFKFSGTLSLGTGRYTVVVTGTDVLGGVGTAGVSGASDVAYQPTAAEWTAENKAISPTPWSGPTPRLFAMTQLDTANPRQNNRAHEVDGCSVPVPELDGTWRNDPMHAATMNEASTEFGSGSRPPTDHFIHGRGPARNLPCNRHDVCYQTVGSSKTTCDSNFYEDMKEVCRKAYPTISNPGLHPIYTSEQSSCYNWARRYYNGVGTPKGQTKFDDRQRQYKYP